ncbi:MAG: XTP/dITP diphosphatase [Eubacteriales bacterium]|nr:XTP/dITP diphosphatase [Eubacteriales bacterium]MDY2826649.1 XTP/dITP diphosphatase [Eubacteriales bacterium]
MEKLEMVLATRNAGKAAELQALLRARYGAKITLLTLSEIGFEGDIEETGQTFAENALLKARAAAAASGKIGLGDDSGLVVPALGGAPGIYSARYAGEHGNDEKNNAMLLQNLSGKTDRRAFFECVLACALPNGENFTVSGRCEGIILESPRGRNGFGYDPLFYVPGLGKTLAEMSGEEKNAISHRGAAVRQFVAAFARRLGKESHDTYQ